MHPRELAALRRMAGMGQNTDPNQEMFLEKRRDFYVYEAGVTNLPVSAQATDTIQIEADSNFILQKLSQFSVSNGLNGNLDVATTVLLTSGLTAQQRVLPNVGIQLVDTGSGRQLMQNPIPIPSLFGTGELPFILPNPRLFMRNSTIQVIFTNFDSVNAYDIRLA